MNRAMKHTGMGKADLRNEIKRQKRLKNMMLYALAAPGLLYLFVNNYLPLSGLVLAFKNYNIRKGILGSDWVGFDNFEYLFKTATAWIITRNTIGYNALFIVVNTCLCVFLAILLNEIRRARVLKFIQTCIMLPHLISMVIVAVLVSAFLSGSNGFMNMSILPLFGKSAVSWYSESKYWPFILTFVNFWKHFGFLTIIYYASVISIDETYYEVAALDGASTYHKIFYITIPMIKTTIVTMVLMNIGRIFFSDFGLFYQVPQDSGMLYSVTNTIDTYVYHALTAMNEVGMASAAGLYQSVIGFILVLISNLIVRKVDSESAMF